MEIICLGSGESLDDGDRQWKIAPLEAPHGDGRDENLLESGGGKLMSRSLDDCKTTQLDAVWRFARAGTRECDLEDG
ncbi:hypothetical protein GCM10025298_31220 [Natronobiforma cellulositropha]